MVGRLLAPRDRAKAKGTSDEWPSASKLLEGRHHVAVRLPFASEFSTQGSAPSMGVSPSLQAQDCNPEEEPLPSGSHQAHLLHRETGSSNQARP